jgi:acetyl-CoA/propionyl-CoA carboxylase, biotin carboxylase, biotin carboxyl carrier protein
MEIRKLLVANRGEIAVRVFATCERVGIATVAVAAPDDRIALHTRRAGETVQIESYLEASEHVRAAKDAGADAIHPGYGFLAENAHFAAAVEEAGLTWIGPPPEVLRAAGDKLAAKRTAAAAGVPVVPDGSPEEIGFPLIVKAAGGGGGRGMRVVRDPAEFDDALAGARREARAAFRDDTVFCERYVERPRHVEVQLLADTQGAVIHLGERECSIQRRHQKVLEESPSPAVSPELRDALGDAAVAFARAVGYRGAGTAEFMLEGDNFWFLELNARIQVEHPVTELVTGIDLIDQQLRVAREEAITLDFEGPEGHAVEARLYAEDPRSFLPQAGRIERLALPDRIRVDAGVEEGDEVPVAYDPLLAKLIAHGETREEAFDLLATALRETEVRGVTTNLPFLRWLVAHPEVRAGHTTTAFLDDYPALSRAPRRSRAWSGGWRIGGDGPRPPRLLTVETTARATDAAGTEQSVVTAPMPGVVVRVLAAEGDRVEPRQPLVVLEAMKMETPLVSPYAALVRRVLVAEGDRVAGGSVLVELEE